jgi:hypothetical protein
MKTPGTMIPADLCLTLVEMTDQGQTGHSDSGGFGLDTRDNLNPTTDPNSHRV